MRISVLFLWQKIHQIPCSNVCWKTSLQKRTDHIYNENVVSRRNQNLYLLNTLRLIDIFLTLIIPLKKRKYCQSYFEVRLQNIIVRDITLFTNSKKSTHLVWCHWFLNRGHQLNGFKYFFSIFWPLNIFIANVKYFLMRTWGFLMAIKFSHLYEVFTLFLN